MERPLLSSFLASAPHGCAPPHSGNGMGGASANRVQSYLKQKLYDPAIADFDAALELVPSHMHAHIERCEANRMLGRYEEVGTHREGRRDD